MLSERHEDWQQESQTINAASELLECGLIQNKGTTIMRLKSWESPRRGRQRNHKSRQASARLRQLKKQRQQLRRQLKTNPKQQQTSGDHPEVFV